MKIRQIKRPVVEPIQLEVAKEFLRVDGNEEDNLISSLIAAAREEAESYQNRAYITQIFELTLDRFPFENYIALPNPPLQSLEIVSYVDSDGNEHIFDASNYILSMYEYSPRISLAYGKHWPSTMLQPVDGVRIQYVAGYGDDGISVPEMVLLAMKLYISHFYEHRGDENVNVPDAFYRLLDRTRVIPI